jgi:peptidyl-prolyl cis-trans isomerase SurA
MKRMPAFKYLSLLLVFQFFASTLSAQQGSDPEMMNIGGKSITKSEFLAIYQKNNAKAQSIDNKSLEEYLELFINFKLKVRHAEELGMDTVKNFRTELDGYRKQLAQPYLTDNEVTEKLIQEAYERMRQDVKASHILINCEPDALPKDTLAAYNKAIQARNKILKGESFAKVAREFSNDPSAKDNAGDLGYFTALQMVYPFETAAYNAEINKVTMPVRTRFGYHLILVTDKRNNLGQVEVAHIMVKAPVGMATEDSVKAHQAIQEIYRKVKAGEDFADLASRYSDDKGSARKGGVLPMFGTGRMVAEFEKASFALKNNGDISEPIKTQYGWHIIKKISKKEQGSFDELKGEIKSRIAKDSRAQQSRESKIEKIKKEYGYKEDLKARDEMAKAIDTTFFNGTWVSEKAGAGTKFLFSIGDKQFTQKDFAVYLESNQTKRGKADAAIVVTEAIKNFVAQECLNYEESKLISKHPEYRALLQEYRDGILLFDLTDKNVWSKAVKDSAGLANFYEQNKKKYMWDRRLQAAIYKADDEKTAAEVRKMLAQKAKKKYTDEDILKAINKESQLKLKIERGKFSKGENELIDKINWAPGLTANQTVDKQVVFVEVEKVLEPEPKSLNEAKGIITADYQMLLEKQWIDELKGKYPVKLNRDVLSTIK